MALLIAWVSLATTALLAGLCFALYADGRGQRRAVQALHAAVDALQGKVANHDAQLEAIGRLIAALGPRGVHVLRRMMLGRAASPVKGEGEGAGGAHAVLVTHGRLERSGAHADEREPAPRPAWRPVVVRLPGRRVLPLLPHYDLPPLRPADVRVKVHVTPRPWRGGETLPPDVAGYYPLARRALRMIRYAVVRSEGDDLCQEIVATAWRRRSAYDHKRGTVEAWFYGIALNDGAIVLQRGRLAEVLGVELDDFAMEGSDDAEERDALWRAVELLPRPTSVRRSSPTT